MFLSSVFFYFSNAFLIIINKRVLNFIQEFVALKRAKCNLYIPLLVIHFCELNSTRRSNILCFSNVCYMFHHTDNCNQNCTVNGVIL